jgi:hypothetical protein
MEKSMEGKFVAKDIDFSMALVEETDSYLGESIEERVYRAFIVLYV